MVKWLLVTMLVAVSKAWFYYTIGTGIGAGVIQRGEFIGGVGHPEMGHYYVAKHPMDVEKNLTASVLSTRAVWKALRLVQV